jgi:hypothetical protein
MHADNSVYAHAAVIAVEKPDMYQTLHLLKPLVLTNACIQEGVGEA